MGQIKMATASSTGNSLLGLLRTCVLQDSVSHFFREIIKNKFMAGIFVQWHLLKDQKKKKKHFNFKFYEFYEQNKNDFVVLILLIIKTLAIGFIRTVFAQTLFRGRICLGLPSSLLSEGSVPKVYHHMSSVNRITNLINTFAQANSRLHFHRNLGSVLKKHPYTSSTCAAASTSLESRAWVTHGQMAAQESLLARLSPHTPAVIFLNTMSQFFPAGPAPPMKHWNQLST